MVKAGKSTSLWNVFENRLIKIIDEIVPLDIYEGDVINERPRFLPWEFDTISNKELEFIWQP